MSTATMTTKGQITVPAGDVRALRGLVAHAGRPVSLEEMDAAVAEGAVEAFKRSVM